MIGDYSIMNLVSIATLLTALGTAAGVIVPIVGLFRDNKAILKRFDELSEKYVVLSDKIMELSKTQHTNLLNKTEYSSQEILNESTSVKKDTSYIKEEMLLEKKSRENLYNSVSNADEVLAKLDFLRETIIQMQALHEKNEDLKSKIVDLKISNKSLSNQLDNQAIGHLISDIRSFEARLSNFEMYHESEEIQFELKRILQELTKG